MFTPNSPLPWCVIGVNNVRSIQSFIFRFTFTKANLKQTINFKQKSRAQNAAQLLVKRVEQ